LGPLKRGIFKNGRSKATPDKDKIPGKGRSEKKGFFNMSELEGVANWLPPFHALVIRNGGIKLIANNGRAREDQEILF